MTIEGTAIAYAPAIQARRVHDQLVPEASLEHPIREAPRGCVNSNNPEHVEQCAERQRLTAAC